MTTSPRNLGPHPSRADCARQTTPVLADCGPDCRGAWTATTAARCARRARPVRRASWCAGSGLRTPAQVAAVFRLLGGDLVVEREAFAERQRYCPAACTRRRRGPRTSRCACITSSATRSRSPA